MLAVVLSVMMSESFISLMNLIRYWNKDCLVECLVVLRFMQ